MGDVKTLFAQPGSEVETQRVLAHMKGRIDFNLQILTSADPVGP